MIIEIKRGKAKSRQSDPSRHNGYYFLKWLKNLSFSHLLNGKLTSFVIPSMVQKEKYRTEPFIMRHSSTMIYIFCKISLHSTNLTILIFMLPFQYIIVFQKDTSEIDWLVPIPINFHLHERSLHKWFSSSNARPSFLILL